MRLAVFVSTALLTFAADPASHTDALLEPFRGSSTPGCAIGVVQDGKTVYVKASGVADLEQSTPLTPKSVFYLASVSKQSMAFAILLLEQQGKLSIDDPVGRYVEGLPAHTASITLRQLLHHTGGVRDYLMLGNLAGYSSDHVWTEADALRTISRQKHLNFTPGSEHLYSNSGYVLLSLAAQNVIGGKLNDWMRQTVWNPLGMTQSRWQQSHSDPVPMRAHGYTPEWRIADSMLDTVGDGGMYASLEDLLLWAANFDTRKLGGGQLDRMAQPGTNAKGYGMGLAQGVYRGLATVSHGGALAGYRTMFYRIPSKRFTTVVLCNRANASPSRLAEQVADIWLQGEFTADAAPHPAPVKPAPADPAAATQTSAQRTAFAGQWYSSELDVTYLVRDMGGKLTLETRDGRELALVAEGGAKLRFAPGGFTLELNPAGVLMLDAGRVRGIEFRKRD